MAVGKTKSKTSSAGARSAAAANVTVEIYDNLIAAALPDVDRKGADNPYTSLNGNMFTLLHQSQNMAIRLPENAREEFLKKHKTTLFSAYGAVMKEYVAVPGSLLTNTREMKKYLQLSYEYARALKPKPTNPKGSKPAAKTRLATAKSKKS